MEQIVKQKVEEVLNQIRPQLQADGGDIQLVEITEEGVVRVELQGACGRCPHSKITLKQGVEAVLKRYIPEVKSVEDIHLKF